MLDHQALASLLREAVECSIYLAPDAPGLTPQELIEVGSRLGYQEGEISDALAWPLAHIEMRNGRYLPSIGVMMIYLHFHQTEEPDYRPIAALNFLYAQLGELAKSVGIRNARIERAVVAERAVQQGIQRLDVDAAIALSVLCDVMVEQDGMVRFNPQKGTWPSPDEQRNQPQGQAHRSVIQRPERWPGKSAQGDKWSFCLNAAMIAAEQERP